MSITPQKSSPQNNLSDFVTASELLACWPFSRASMYNWAHAGDFVKPEKIGRKRYLWRRSLVNAWLAERGLPLLPSPVSK